MSSEIFHNYRLLGSRRIFPEPGDSTLGLGGRDISHKTWRKFNDQDRLEMRLLRTTILDILGIKNFSEVVNLFNDEKTKEKLNTSFIDKYANSYGLNHLTLEEKRHRVSDALETADNRIKSLENPETGIFRQYRTSIGMINEIEAIKNPIDLLLIIFSPKASKILRYEARRKLLFMDSAFRSQIVTESYDKDTDFFLRFLNSHVWQGGLGYVKKVEVTTTHSPIDYSCQEVHLLEKDEKVSLSDYRRYTEFSMRSWVDNKGNERLAFVEHRRKDPLDMLTKLMRKDTRDPYKIDDYTGMKFVFFDKKDISNFLDMLQKKAKEIRSYVKYEEIYDTISNPEKFRITNIGSSDDLEIVKVTANIAGKKLELQMHTIRTFMDSRYKDVVGFEEYSLRRFFDSGVIDLFYPRDIYGINLGETKESLIKQKRMSVRLSAIPEIPLNRREEGRRYERYTTSDFVKDIAVIVEQLTEFPDEIVAVGHSGLVVATALSKILNGVPITEYKTEKEVISTKTRKVLIVHGIIKDGRRIKDLKKLLPEAKVAVLGIKYPDEEITKHVNYRARVVDKNIWYHYYWDIPELKTGLTQGLILFYRINPSSNQIEFLVQEQPDLENRNLKLIGGKKEIVDQNLKETVEREFEEESGHKLDKKDLIVLSDVTYDMINRSSIEQPLISKGFARAYARKVKGDLNFTPIHSKDDSEDVRYVWVTADEFFKRSQWESQTKGMTQWYDEILKIEGLK